LGRRKWIRKSRTVRRGTLADTDLKTFEDLNLIEGNENDIGPAVRANE
jgi:hypothetical protein